VKSNRSRLNSESGVTLGELIIGLAISAIMTAVTVPTTRTAISSYRLNAAAGGAAAAIQSTRYQAIMRGYSFQITLDSTTNSYQLLSKPIGANAFSNVGTAIGLSPTGPITLSATNTFQFSPNGTVCVVNNGACPAMSSATFTISNSTGTKTITVSGVGNVGVTP
jgi:Tfp pilus assembly protein FimT